jgi:hypothetical protein
VSIEKGTLMSVERETAKVFVAAHGEDFAQVSGHPEFGDCLGAWDRTTGLWVFGPKADALMEQKLMEFGGFNVVSEA